MKLNKVFFVSISAILHLQHLALNKRLNKLELAFLFNVFRRFFNMYDFFTFLTVCNFLKRFYIYGLNVC